MFLWQHYITLPGKFHKGHEHIYPKIFIDQCNDCRDLWSCHQVGWISSMWRVLRIGGYIVWILGVDSWSSPRNGMILLWWMTKNVRKTIVNRFIKALEIVHSYRDGLRLIWECYPPDIHPFPIRVYRSISFKDSILVGISKKSTGYVGGPFWSILEGITLAALFPHPILVIPQIKELRDVVWWSPSSARNPPA